jgi:tyrosine-protein kinase Etk/Wzc
MQLAQAEIEILKSRLVLGSTIRELNLDIQVSPSDSSLWQRLIDPMQFHTNYDSTAVQVQKDDVRFEIRKLIVPQEYVDEALLLQFQGADFSLTDTETDQVVYKGKLNQAGAVGPWQVSIYAPTSLNASFVVTKNAIPTVVKSILDNYGATERGKQTGVIALRYQGTDNVHITKVLNLILNTYKQQNVERNSAEKAQTLHFLQQQLPKLKKELDDTG